MFRTSTFSDFERVVDDVVLCNTVVLGESSQAPEGDFQRKEHVPLVIHQFDEAKLTRILRFFFEIAHQVVQDSSPGKVTFAINWAALIAQVVQAARALVKHLRVIVLSDYLLNQLEQRVQAFLLLPGDVLAQVEISPDLLGGDALAQHQRQLTRLDFDN